MSAQSAQEVIIVETGEPQSLQACVMLATSVMRELRMMTQFTMMMHQGTILWSHMEIHVMKGEKIMVLVRDDVKERSLFF